MRVFMAEDNICAQNLLKLVSHGNAVIAELLRLKDYIPQVYRFGTKDAQKEYQDIIMDFSYFNISDVQEKKINSNPKLQEVNDEIKESTLEMVSRIYTSLQSIYEYANDLNNFVEQLDENAYIQQSIETVMQDLEGKQLLCESLYLYGCMLLLVDMYVSGPVRERLLVAFYRYSTSQSQSNVDAVCTLLRDTGHSHARRPACYPEEYFNRIPMKVEFVEAVISKLRSEDIYNQLALYPVPEQRSTALACKANMLFICLFFCPHYLHSDTASMREIVDNFFSDNWVISMYMGVTLNVLDFWDSFKAAKAALTNTYNSKSVKMITEKYVVSVPTLMTKITALLKEGTLTDDYVLDNTNKIISLLRESNVTIRWLILHGTKTTFVETCKRSKQLKDIVVKEVDSICLNVLQLLIGTAELELKVREMLTLLLNNRYDSWSECKKKASDAMSELNESLSEKKTANKIPEIDQLKLWFEDTANQINSLGDNITSKSTKKVVQLTRALEKVIEFHNIRSVPTVLQAFTDTQEALKNCLRISNLKEESLISLETIADVSYAWCSIDRYTGHMQDMIKQNPAVTSSLRALFLKLSTAMEIPLLRINQARSDDLVSVSQYYSRELILYIEKVLQIIPEMVFSILAKIIELQTWRLKEIPTRLEKEQLREFAQLEERMEVARLTHSASTFTKGILDMRTTLVGVVCVDPAHLLEEGLHRELSRHIHTKFRELLAGAPGRRGAAGAGGATLLPLLDRFASSMDGYRRSLEYIQDYINIHGLKIWQNQMTSIISESVSAEVSGRRGVAPAAPSAGVMGALARQVALLCDTRCCTYISTKAAWFDTKTHSVVIDDKTFSKLNEAIGPAGLYGLDTLYSFMIKHQLQGVIEAYKLSTNKDKFWSELNKNTGNNIIKHMEVIQQAKLTHVVDFVLSIGTLQTLRRHIAHQLNTSAKFDSVHLEASLETLNEAMINELKMDAKNDKIKMSMELLQTVDDHLVRCGLYDPYEKIYIKTSAEQKSVNMSYMLALLVLTQVPKMHLCLSTGDLTGKKVGDNLDGHALLVGVYSVLRQYHHDYVDTFVQHICDYLIQQSVCTIKSKPVEISQDMINIIHWMEHFCHEFRMPFKDIENKLPIELLTYMISTK